MKIRCAGCEKINEIQNIDSFTCVHCKEYNLVIPAECKEDAFNVYENGELI